MSGEVTAADSLLAVPGSALDAGWYWLASDW